MTPVPNFSVKHQTILAESLFPFHLAPYLLFLCPQQVHFLSHVTKTQKMFMLFSDHQGSTMDILIFLLKKTLVSLLTQSSHTASS